MSTPVPWKGIYLSFTLLFTIVAAEATVFPANFFYYSFHSHRLNPCNNSLIYVTTDTGLLKTEDTTAGKMKNRDRPSSGYIRREKNSDLVIEIPNVANGKYRLRFYDENGRFLFEVRQIHDSYLVVEKYNFLHAGSFRYELYKDNQVIESREFQIKIE
jgi:hypothetical protein